MRGFFRELKKRRVYRAAIAYGLAASAFVQIGGTVLTIFGTPLWLQQLLLVLIALGFPVVLMLAWAFELTPEGLERTRSPRWMTAAKLHPLIVLGAFGTLIAGLAVAGYWFWQPWSSKPHDKAAPSGAAPAILPANIPHKSIAVLPFQNLSRDEENAFFARGVQGEILTNLAKVADLKVISRLSVEQYASDAPRDRHQIGQQLGVAHILEGTVHRVANRVRVTAQLIDARTDAQLWAERYDRDIADVFAIQSEVAEAIVEQLQAKLSQQEKARIEEPPTRDLAAYDLYLEANRIVDGYLNEDDPRSSLSKAVRLLEEATARDPNFVLAFCYLARAHGLLYFLDLDPNSSRCVMAEQAVKTALRLRPDSGDAHLAAGDHRFRCYRDYEGAERELAIARSTLPNNLPFFILTGYIDRRQGLWKQSEANLRKAVELDPRNPNAVNLLADHYVLVRDFPAAVEVSHRAAAAGLDSPIDRIRRAAVVFEMDGDAVAFRAALAAAPADLDVGGGETPWRILTALAADDYDGALAAIAASPLAEFQDVDFTFYYPRSWFEALIARARGDAEAAQRAFAEARKILEERLKIKPDDPRTLAVLAQVDAGLARKDLAVAEAQRAVDLMPVEKDAYDGPLVLQGLAQVYTWTGEVDRALELLQRLVSMPGYLSYGYLLHDPIWDPLRGDQRFAAILNSQAPAPAR
jgi:serine/threonine-protein kinase